MTPLAPGQRRSEPYGAGEGGEGLSIPVSPKPFLKWPGGKRWLVAAYSEILDISFERHIEPFLGAGSVYFHLHPQRAVLGDLNCDVITAFRGVKEDWEAVQRALDAHHQAHSHEHYYRVREEIPETLADRAARIIYLNRTCFNGIYRVNRAGKFNVPIGSRTQVTRDSDDLGAAARLLASANLRQGDFEELADEAHDGDLLFMDPPYTVRHNQNGFIKYNEKLFSWDDQERLAKAAARAAERGAYVIVTNASHPTVQGLYDSRLFSLRTVNRFSPVSARSQSRSQYEELVVTSRR